ncbi:hypothetical protein [Agrococcus sp. HG114]|uniref:hypothetical protein n=1 Tax=Agrococcus sp. HG114 TaxID=2969757 RepID=UPI00215B004B|nr:hypothetical protein [Agrococcus sp. HG114]MCR8670689.1 hypothetical protein [Agrococcus sp. HG114]
MPTRTHRIRRLFPTLIVAATAGLVLTGCEPGVFAPSESPEPSSSVTAAPSETPSSTPVDTPTPTPAPTGSALPTTPPIAGELPCSEVYTADQLYEFNPNFAPSSDEGSLPGAIQDVADAGGTVCAYQHVTGSDRLVVGVLQDASGFAAPAFETVGDMGVAATPVDGTIVAVASQYFATERDAQQVLDQVIANVG